MPAVQSRTILNPIGLAGSLWSPRKMVRVALRMGVTKADTKKSCCHTNIVDMVADVEDSEGR